MPRMLPPSDPIHKESVPLVLRRKPTPTLAVGHRRRPAPLGSPACQRAAEELQGQTSSGRLRWSMASSSWPAPASSSAPFSSSAMTSTSSLLSSSRRAYRACSARRMGAVARVLLEGGRGRPRSRPRRRPCDAKRPRRPSSLPAGVLRPDYLDVRGGPGARISPSRLPGLQPCGDATISQRCPLRFAAPGVALATAKVL